VGIIAIEKQGKMIGLITLFPDFLAVIEIQ
jgi:hypothetical protein